MRRIFSRCCARAAEQRDELAALIKKTRSHGTIAMRVGSAKRLRSARYLRFSSSRVGRRPVGNSFDDLVCACEQRWRHFEAERPGGLEIDHQRILYRRLDRQVGCLLTPQNAIDVAGGLPMLLDVIGSVGDQPAAGSESAAG